jgi:signal transduction histidine kinase
MVESVTKTPVTHEQAEAIVALAFGEDTVLQQLSSVRRVVQRLRPSVSNGLGKDRVGPGLPLGGSTISRWLPYVRTD